jgi:hypothetical protein
MRGSLWGRAPWATHALAVGTGRHEWAGRGKHRLPPGGSWKPQFSGAGSGGLAVDSRDRHVMLGSDMQAVRAVILAERVLRGDLR